MKRTILVVGILLGVMLAGAAVFWGCNKEAEISPSQSRSGSQSAGGSSTENPNRSMTVAIQSGTVHVTDIVTDLTSGTVQFQMQIQPNQGMPFDRSLTVGFSRDSAQNVVMASQLVDGSGRALFDFSYAICDDAGDHTKLSIKTSVRSISVEHTQTDSIFREQYWADHDSRVLSWPVSSADHVRDVFQQGFYSGKFDRTRLAVHLPQDKDVIQQLEDFQKFYFAHSEFDCGPDCRLGMELLSSQQLMQRAHDELDAPGNSIIEKFDLKKFCLAAHACAAVSCWWGAILNPVCDICAAISIWCILIELFSR